MIPEPTSIGAVSRVMHDDGVTLEVRPSRNALLILVIIGIVPAGAVAAFVALAASMVDDVFAGGTRSVEAMFSLGTVFVMTAAVCAATFKPLTRLLRTAARRAAFTVDARELRLLERGFFDDTTMLCPRGNVLDVLVRYRQAGIFELHVVPNDRPPTVLLYGGSEAELEFLAAELRRALGVDRLLREAAGVWGDYVDAAPEAQPVVAAPPIDTSPPVAVQPLLQYAPESNDDVIRHRGAGGVRLVVPPLRPQGVLRQNKWFIVLFAVCAVACVEPYMFGWLRFVVRPMLMLIVPVMALCAAWVGWQLLKCLPHVLIDATADDLMLTVRWPVLGRTTTRWSVDAIRGIRAVKHTPPRVEFCLRSGRRQTLAYLATYGEAEELAAQLQRAQLPVPPSLASAPVAADPPAPSTPPPSTPQPSRVSA